MLLNKFYEIISLKRTNSGIQVLLKFNSQHPIFSGHFPSAPIVPGACLILMIREILSIYYQIELRIIRIENAKFIKAINPELQPVVDLIVNVEIKDSAIYHFSGIFSQSEIIYANCKGFLKEFLVNET